MRYIAIAILLTCAACAVEPTTDGLAELYLLQVRECAQPDHPRFDERTASAWAGPCANAAAIQTPRGDPWSCFEEDTCTSIADCLGAIADDCLPEW